MYEQFSEGLSDDDFIRYTQGVRKAYIAETLTNGFPEDIKEKTLLLTALSDMDRTALGNKRIGANEKQAAADAMVARAIAEVSRQFGEINPFCNGAGNVPSFDSSKLPEPNPVEGETDIGLSEQNYDELIKKFD